MSTQAQSIFTRFKDSEVNGTLQVVSTMTEFCAQNGCTATLYPGKEDRNKRKVTVRKDGQYVNLPASARLDESNWERAVLCQVYDDAGKPVLEDGEAVFIVTRNPLDGGSAIGKTIG